MDKKEKLLPQLLAYAGKKEGADLPLHGHRWD